MGDLGLAAKVAAVNRANAFAMEIHPKLVAALAPLVGRQVVKATGDLLKSVKLPALPAGSRLHVYRTCSRYALAWVVKTCESVPPVSCVYHETSVYVGELDGTILKCVCQAPAFRTDYTAAEIVRLRSVYEAARTAADEARAALVPFGEYDR